VIPEMQTVECVRDLCVSCCKLQSTIERMEQCDIWDTVYVIRDLSVSFRNLQSTTEKMKQCDTWDADS
jgi:hypothetical protein